MFFQLSFFVTMEALVMLHMTLRAGDEKKNFNAMLLGMVR